MPVQPDDNLLSILRTLFRWKKTFQRVLLLTLVGSLIATLLMKNYYKAMTVFYPGSAQSANSDLMFGSTGVLTEFYGNDHDLDHISEIANSDELANYLITKFKLYQHYGQDSANAKGYFKTREIFWSLYTADKNKNDAVEIIVEDTDPQLATNLANAAREKVADMAQSVIKESQKNLLASFERNIGAKRAELVRLNDSIMRVQTRYGIIETEAQGEWLGLQYSKTETEITRLRAALEVLDNNPNIRRDTVEFIKANLHAAEKTQQRLLGSPDDRLNIRRFTEGLPQVYIMKDLNFQSRKQLSYDLERYYQIRAAYETPITAIHTISAADTPRVKSRPKRMFIVAGALVAAFLFTMLGCLLAEAYQDVDWRKELRIEN